MELNGENGDDEEVPGFNYTPGTEWILADQEYEPDPNEEDVEGKVLTPLEFCNNAFVLRKYCTNQQVIEEHKMYKKIVEQNRRRNPMERPKPVEWVADDLYGSVVGRKGPVGPNPLEVDPSLHTRNKEPIVLTPEEEYYYGPMEPASPPPIPKPVPLDSRHPSTTQTLSDGETPNSRESMPDTSNNNVPQDKPEGIQVGGLWFPHVRSTESIKWNGHPMEHPDLMCFYEEDFRLIPGDVIIFTRPRLKQSTVVGEPPTLRCLVSIYEDRHYFDDHGQFRQNFLDKYPLEQGDLVVRFGNFNQRWLWNRHPTINFYMYWPGLRPPLGSDKKILHPWYWIDHGLLQYGGPLGATLPIPPVVAPANMPLGVKAPHFELRYGDLLIHHNKNSINFGPPFDHKLECHVWNPLLEGIGQNTFVRAQDRVLRHGMIFQYYGSPLNGICASIAHVELYNYDEEGNWKFLGRWTSEFSDHLKREPFIRPVGLVPLAGDIVFDNYMSVLNKRGRWTRGWNDRLDIGGVVSFHKNEFYKDMGREARPFVWYKDAGRYGTGNITMVLRLGYFKNDDLDEWTWHHGESAQLFILNTRTSAWRLNSNEKWPQHLEFNKPNYSWQPYNSSNFQEVSPNFGPKAGDIIIRISWDNEHKREKKEDPVYAGTSFNPHYVIKVQMGIYGPHFQVGEGDFLIRAGYERNSINQKWTNATVECYFYDRINGQLRWTCKGRDIYTFGTDYLRGGLQGVESSGFGDYSVDDIAKHNSNRNRPRFENI